MQAQVLPSQVSTEDIVAQIFCSRRITRANQKQLMSALLSKDWLGEQERKLIDRVFNGVREGFLKVVD